MIPHFGFRPADDAVITTLQREAEMRSVRLAVHAARLDLERKRLADEGAKAEQERKRRRNRLYRDGGYDATNTYHRIGKRGRQCKPCMRRATREWRARNGAAK